MKIAHLTTVDMSLRYLVFPQLKAALQYGESIGISAPGPYVEHLVERGIRHIPLHASTRGMSVTSDIKAAAQLWKALRREHVDILHTHNPKPGLYGRVIGRLAGVPIVINTVHGLYATEDASPLKRAAVYGAEWVASRFSDAELVQNPEDLQLMQRLGMTPRARTHLLGNGVDLERFDPERAEMDREQMRSELGVTEDQILVGMVGRLVGEKGVPELIEATAGLDDRFVVAIAGPHDPEKEDSLTEEMIRKGEKSGVRFLGMRSDVERLYAAFDVFVLPSHREGFPRAAMEAAASGLPVIATDIRGCRQVVDDALNGFLFQVGDVDDLRAKIELIGSDPELRERMSLASVAKSRAEFDESRVVEKVMATYEDVARRKGLGWCFGVGSGAIDISGAADQDAAAIARLHESMISGGFLSTLGHRFLVLLYRNMIEDESSEVLVARRGEAVVGFVAGTKDTSSFYRRFLAKSSLRALMAILPALVRPSTWRRIYEVLRYGTVESPVRAELLSMAVAPLAQGVGLGGRLVEALLDWGRGAGLASMKVVVGAGNDRAISLYRRSGFDDATEISVHGAEPSWELVWSA